MWQMFGLPDVLGLRVESLGLVVGAHVLVQVCQVVQAACEIWVLNSLYFVFFMLSACMKTRVAKGVVSHWRTHVFEKRVETCFNYDVCVQNMLLTARNVLKTPCVVSPPPS